MLPTVLLRWSWCYSYFVWLCVFLLRGVSCGVLPCSLFACFFCLFVFFCLFFFQCSLALRSLAWGRHLVYAYMCLVQSYTTRARYGFKMNIKLVIPSLIFVFRFSFFAFLFSFFDIRSESENPIL